jgi:hypothetical protein
MVGAPKSAMKGNRIARNLIGSTSKPILPYRWRTK